MKNNPFKSFIPKISRKSRENGGQDKKKRPDPGEDLIFGANASKKPSWEQTKYFYKVLPKKERIIAYAASVLLAASVVGLLGYAYFSNTEAMPENGGEYTEALVGYPEHINPILAQTNDVDMDLSRLIFSGLFKYNENQELVPDLVETYEMSEDQKEYSFKIREGVVWHDGEPLTADDVVFTISAIQDENFQSPLLPSLRGVGVEKVDDHNFKLFLKEPFAPFLSTLTFGIMPKHIWYDAYSVSAKNVLLTEYNIKPIGSGPYRFKKLVKDRDGNIKSFHLEKNENYFGRLPYIENLNFIFYPDMSAAVEAAGSKKAEGLAFVPYEDQEELHKMNRKLEFHSLRLPQYTALFFNQKEGDDNVLAYKAVREALAHAVPRKKIIEQVLGGNGEPIFAPILPGYVGYNPEIKKYDHDPKQAREILKEGGWTKKEGEEYRSRNDRILEFTVVTVDQPESIQALDMLKEEWEELGMKININTYSVEDIQAEIIKGRDYEALLFGEIVGTDPDPYPFWHSSQDEHPGLNLAIPYKRLKDVDQLLEEARVATEDEERAKKYYHFQNILADEIPAIFLYNPHYTYAVHKKVKGMESQYITTPSDRFAGIDRWYIKTDRKWKSKGGDEEEVDVVELPPENASPEASQDSTDSTDATATDVAATDAAENEEGTAVEEEEAKEEEETSAQEADPAVAGEETVEEETEEDN